MAPRSLRPLWHAPVAALLALMSVAAAAAAELVMLERQGCPWCEVFDREIAPIYPKTPEGLRAPLRRHDINQPLPSDLRFLTPERFTPTFVLIDGGREIGRIRGYPGAEHFWGLLGALLAPLDAERRKELSQ